MKVLGLIGMVLISVACNSAAPTATAYKQQLGAPAPVVGSNNATPTGDPALGQTALTSCTGCHADGGIGHVLAAADADSIGKGRAGTNPVHGGVPQNAKDAFKNNAADMAAFLSGASPAGAGAAGDAAKGETLLTGPCAACHGVSAGDLDSFSNLEGQETASYHPANIQSSISANKADIAAALKLR